MNEYTVKCLKNRTVRSFIVTGAVMLLLCGFGAVVSVRFMIFLQIAVLIGVGILLCAYAANTWILRFSGNTLTVLRNGKEFMKFEDLRPGEITVDQTRKQVKNNEARICVRGYGNAKYDVPDYTALKEYLGEKGI